MKQIGAMLGLWRASLGQWWGSRGQELRRRLPLRWIKRPSQPCSPAAIEVRADSVGDPAAATTPARDPALQRLSSVSEPPVSGPAAAATTLTGPGGGLRRSVGLMRAVLAALPGGARPWIALVTLGFVMAVLMANGHDLLQMQPDGQAALWLVLATGLTLASLVVNGLALAGVLAWLGKRPRWEATVSLFVATNLRKYLPGGIWHLAARVEALRGPQAPVSPPLGAGSALLVTLLEPLLAATAALVLVALGGWQNGLGLLAVLPLLLLMPGRLRRVLPALERRRARELHCESELVSEGDQALALPGYPWPPLLLELVFVLLRFAGFACCVLAFELHSIIPWTTWLAGFALAWTAGLVVPGAPGGLGVFETVLLLRLRVALPDTQLLAVALSYRLISTVADLLGAGLVEADQHLPGLLQRLGGPLSRVLPQAPPLLRLPRGTGSSRADSRVAEAAESSGAKVTQSWQQASAKASAATPEAPPLPPHPPLSRRLLRFLPSTWRRP